MMDRLQGVGKVFYDPKPTEDKGGVKDTISPPVEVPTGHTKTSYLGNLPRTRGRSATVATSAETASSVVDPEFEANLRSVLDSAKTPGFNEVMTQYNELAEDIPDDTKRLTRAVSIVSKMLKLTPDQIRQSIEERLAILTNEREEFTRSISAEADDSVSAQQDEVRACDKRLAEIETELLRLEDEKKKTQTRKSDATAQISAVTVQVDAVRRRFESAYTHHFTSLSKFLERLK
jgi:predicted  nucleic acid-binding Zn-ribbon protein